MSFLDIFKSRKREIKNEILKLETKKKDLEVEYNSHVDKFETVWRKYHSNEINYTMAMKVDSVCYDLKKQIKDIDTKIKQLKKELNLKK